MALTMFFPANLHNLDRLTRLILRLAMMLIGWNAEDGMLAFALRLFAFYPLITALVNWCPLYELLGFSTKK